MSKKEQKEQKGKRNDPDYLIRQKKDKLEHVLRVEDKKDSISRKYDECQWIMKSPVYQLSCRVCTHHCGFLVARSCEISHQPCSGPDTFRI